MTDYLLPALLMWNGTVFFIYAMDKFRARTGRWRISERTLIGCGFLAGGLGAFAGMVLLRHKTRRLKFRLLLPLAALLTAVILLCVLWPVQMAELARTLMG